jgi:hypothetical protein
MNLWKLCFLTLTSVFRTTTHHHSTTIPMHAVHEKKFATRGLERGFWAWEQIEEEGGFVEMLTLILFLMRILELVLHVSFLKNQKSFMGVGLRVWRERKREGVRFCCWIGEKMRNKSLGLVFKDIIMLIYYCVLLQPSPIVT